MLKIFKGTIPFCYEHLQSKIWKVCCRLTAFLPPLARRITIFKFTLKRCISIIYICIVSRKINGRIMYTSDYTESLVFSAVHQSDTSNSELLIVFKVWVMASLVPRCFRESCNKLNVWRCLERTTCMQNKT